MRIRHQFFLAVCLVIFASPAFAYIDPNTGGYLFQLLAPLAALAMTGWMFFTNQVKSIYRSVRNIFSSPQNEDETKPSSILSIFLRLTRQVFLNISIILIVFFLPIEILFRASSWTLFMPMKDIVNEIAMMALLMAIASLCLALIVGAIGAVIVGASRTKARKSEEVLCALVSIVALAIIAFLLLRTLKSWLKLVSGFTFTVGAAKPLFLLLIIAFFIFLIWKYGLLTVGDAIQSRLAKGNKVVIAVMLLSSILIALNGGIALHNFNQVIVNPAAPPQAKMPNVILLSIDTLTAEDMSLHGYHLPTTPRINAFAQESYVFDNFFSSSNWTTPSVASFISGLYPTTSGVHHTYGYFLEADRKKNLPQLLKDHGYNTNAIVANGFAHPLTLRISDSFSAVTEPPVTSFFASDSVYNEIFRLKNYRTFWWLEDLLQPLTQTMLFSIETENSLWPPELVFNRSEPFLAPSSQPSFTWSHINPPHGPYLPSAPFKYSFGNFQTFSKLKDFEGYSHEYLQQQQAGVDQQRLRYDEFILDTDSRVGTFLDHLKKTGRFDDSIIIVTADHGESFAKNYLYHGGAYLHQPLIHIPLLIHLPGQKTGKRVPYYASQVDLLPTVLDLLNLPAPKWAEGESLKAAMLDSKPTIQPKFSMNLDSDSRFYPPRKGTIAVMHDGWKFVKYLASGKEELYQLATDPKETKDLAILNPAQAKKMREMITHTLMPAKPLQN